jgi:hypothetical protein
LLGLAIDVSLRLATQGHQGGPAMPLDYGWNQTLQSQIPIISKIGELTLSKTVNIFKGSFHDH